MTRLPLPPCTKVIFAGRHSPHRSRKKRLPCKLRWNGPPPTTPSTHSQFAPTASRFSSDPPSKIPPERLTGPDEPPVDTRAQRNTRQRARRHRSRFNQQRPSRPIFYASARSLIRRTLTDPPPTNPRTMEVYGGFSWSKGCTATSIRADAVLLARLRAGHKPLLKAYANLLDPFADPLCPLCKEESKTIEHWLLRCPRLDATRQNIFGSPSPPLKVLTTDPERVLALARVTVG